MRFLLILLIFIAHSAHGYEIVRIQNRVIFKDQKCEATEKIIPVLRSWSIQKDQSRECIIKKIESKDNSCELDIHDCLPLKMQTFLGISPEKAGPNCHNLSLVMKGMTSSLYYTEPSEIIGFLNNSPLCRHLENTETRLAGDVGFISGETIFDTHSFIYLSDDFYLSKNGAGDSPYGIFDSTFIKNGYLVTNKEKCTQNTSASLEQCPIRMNFYRCMSMDDYLKGKKISVPFQNAVKATAMYEVALECMNFGHKIDSKPIKQLVKDSLSALKILLEDLKYKVIEGDSIDEENNFMLGTLSLKLESLEMNLTFYDQPRGRIGASSDNFSSKSFKPKNPNGFSF